VNACKCCKKTAPGGAHPHLPVSHVRYGKALGKRRPILALEVSRRCFIHADTFGCNIFAGEASFSLAERRWAARQSPRCN
jgi:hypothetical protein